MQYRRFGRTELQMPVFSCGGMRYQHSWNDVPLNKVPQKNQENLEATIRRSLEVGINHIETARAYGSSEAQLGEILPTLPRNEIIVQTKVSPCAQPEEFRKTLERSLAALKLDYIDLFSFHGVNTNGVMDYVLEGGCLEVAQAFQRQGRIRFLGFSTHAPLWVILRGIESDQFDYLNLHWYFINQDNWPAIQAAQQHDMGVFIISPSDKGGHLYNPSAKLVELCQPLSPIVFNDLFCLSRPEIHTLSIGAARPTDFDEHLKTLPLVDSAADILLPIVQRLEQTAIDVLGADWCRTWKVGLPTPEETPGNINIPAILWLYNLLEAFEMEEFAKARYNLLGNGGHWFPGQKADGVESLDLAACLQRSPHASRIPALLKQTHQRLVGQAVARLSNA